MTEFLNYKVVLHFKDGTESQGFISNVDSTLISLGNKSYKNTLVKDLKVVSLPSEKSKKKNVHGGIGGEAMQMSSSKSISRVGTPKMSKKQPDWGSDVGDIKVSDDFDFQANLAMFDKKSVFADFQKNESINALDRLVSLNKVNDKYDNDENVLSGQNKDNWNSIGSISQRLTLPAPAANGPSIGSHLAREQQLYSFTYEDDPTAVPLASPVQLLEIERIATESFSVDQKAFSEVCAVNLFLLILSKILGGSVRLNQRKNHNLPPLVLLLVGGGRSSSRAFALGRHLTNHGVRVLAYVINEEMVDGETLHQCQLFEKCGGKVVSAKFAELLDILHKLDTPVELIIDSLQGLEGQLSDLFYTAESMATLTQVVNWVNEPKQSSRILSLDVSSGLDGGSGTASLPHLVVKSRYIVSMGLPLSGLVHAYNNGSLSEEITHYVVDVGVPNAVYNSRPHLRKFDKFWFCAEQHMKITVKSE
ncbi:hypothetical protein PUMCH_003065 [Australozyma saopauloensis]|uniref:Enhancer of mRNA-decapping protein 3 n=1 Tax=Australozyma saopauloensis TaxID=291208 RepID=A0AAX4HB18_9ASCO|nr:hypothetical protein PUMCH_003065 [[Candida] saopauloensis]